MIFFGTSDSCPGFFVLIVVGLMLVYWCQYITMVFLKAQFLSLLASFNELKIRTAIGIKNGRITDYTRTEQCRKKGRIAITKKLIFRSYKNIIATKKFNKYTVDDLEKKTTELNKILEDLAKTQDLSISELFENMA